MKDEITEYTFRETPVNMRSNALFITLLSLVNVIGYIWTTRIHTDELRMTKSEYAEKCEPILSHQVNLTMSFDKNVCISKDEDLCELTSSGDAFYMRPSQKDLEQQVSSTAERMKESVSFGVIFSLGGGFLIPFITNLIGLLGVKKSDWPKSPGQVFDLHDKTKAVYIAQCSIYLFIFVYGGFGYHKFIKFMLEEQTCTRWAYISCLAIPTGSGAEWEPCRTFRSCFDSGRIFADSVIIMIGVSMWVDAIFFNIRLFVNRNKVAKCRPSNIGYIIYKIDCVGSLVAMYTYPWQTIVRYYPWFYIVMGILMFRIFIMSRQLVPNPVSVLAMQSHSGGFFSRCFGSFTKRNYEQDEEIHELWDLLERNYTTCSRLLCAQVVFETVSLMIVMAMFVMSAEGWSCFAGRHLSDYTCDDCFDAYLQIEGTVWFIMATVTTVGYGDVSPRTFAGRVVVIVVMVLSLMFVQSFVAYHMSRFKLMENIFAKAKSVLLDRARDRGRARSMMESSNDVQVRRDALGFARSSAKKVLIDDPQTLIGMVTKDGSTSVTRRKKSEEDKGASSIDKESKRRLQIMEERIDELTEGLNSIHEKVNQLLKTD